MVSRSAAAVCSARPPGTQFTTQFTCFTSTKVQRLTPEDLLFRQAAEPDIFDFWQGEGMPLAFGEQHAMGGGGRAGGGAVGGAGGGGLEAAGRDGGGEGKKRKKVNESTFGAVAEMDFCRELVHIADVATGRHMQAPLAFKEHVPSGEAQAQEAKGALLLLRVCTKILENVVLLDVYRAHLFSGMKV